MNLLKRLNYRHIFPDIFIILFSFFASLYLRLGWEGLPTYLPIMANYAALFLSLRIGTFILMGVYDIIWRYISTSDAAKIVKAILLSSLLVIAATYLVDIGRLPRSTFIIDAFLVTILLTGIRLLRRIIFEHSSGKTIQELGKRTLIYGAGTNGRTITHRLKTDKNLGLNLIGFIDDNHQKVGRFISGVKVLGTGDDLRQLIKNYNIEEIIIAISAPNHELLRKILHISHSLKIHPRLFANATHSKGQNKSFELFRDIQLSDLLERASKIIDVNNLKNLIRGRRVLITGAGGSIGSELARQIIKLDPSRLILADHSEYNLYKIDQELGSHFQRSSELTIPCLIDLKDKISLEILMKESLPEVVFHAAAYKHVHLCESNSSAAILNNILGTKNLLELSELIDVNTFVLISTDKAVNPAGIMGATKRACELIVTEYGNKLNKRYCSVRFGNVLGSSGSLIPLLQKQIQNDEPVTITHKDMRRYFMLISEAVSLVLTSAQLSDPGDILILRMGKPLKIVDITTNLITLMGKTTEQVPLIFTDIRPGEKMFEELYLSGNELKTDHPDVLVVPKGDKSQNDLLKKDLVLLINKIISSAYKGSKEAVYELNSLVKVNTIEIKSPKLNSLKPKLSSLNNPES